MSGRLGRVAVGVLAVVLVVAGVAAATVPAERVLVVEDADTGEELLAVPVENGTAVALEYTHSVEGSRVLDAYAVRGDRLDMTRTEFKSYGWGFPARANVTRENGSFVYDPDVTTEELYVSPGRIAGHRLHVGDRTYDLIERSNAESVRIHLERRTILERITP
ncbi:DUF1850 domain-containing protein [Halegenticoccus soli]|uniref:DUF1850 domain-containing protein n=1 Tax=Halegenticoccus soli TaxID=1985678 RepID=UPI000C6E23BD|nr:DUF1850 domain-containing protein [Halegenticoccus soli]